MTRKLAALVLAAVLSPALALGQDAAPKLEEDPRAPKFKDVERGFFIGFEAGYMGMLKTPTADPEKFPLAGTGGGNASGVMIGALMGVDVASFLSVALYAQGGNARASQDYGAFSVYAAGLDVKIPVSLGGRDPNGYQRLYLFAHGRLGYAKTYPEGLFGTNDLLGAGGLGVEYYTRLRHYSIGLVFDGLYAVKAKASGYAVYPTIRYTF